MKLLVDFWRFPRIYNDLGNMITKLFLFWFDFHISAEQFYDRNKQELVKTRENHKSTNNAMSNDGSSIEIIDQSQGDSAVFWNIFEDFDSCTSWLSKGI